MANTIGYIQVEALTPEAYRPFGYVVGMRDQPPAAQNEERAYWESPELELLEGSFKVVCVDMQMTDYVIRRLHRHHTFAQTLIPLGGKAFIHVAAPPGDVPDLSQIRAFLIDGNQGVIIGRGTWHRNPAYPLAPKASLILISGGAISSRVPTTPGARIIGGSTEEVEISKLTDVEIRLLL